MVEHRWFQPAPQQAEPCDCDLCLGHDQVMTEMEAAIAQPVGVLLDAGWLPKEIAALVKTGSPASSKASMLVRIDLLRRAEAWMHADDFGEHLAQSFELAKRTGFRPGEPQAGWFEDWMWRRGGIGKAQLFIRHEITAALPVLALIGQIQGDTNSWRTVLPPARVIGRRRFQFPYERLVPEAGDMSWMD